MPPHTFIQTFTKKYIVFITLIIPLKVFTQSVSFLTYQNIDSYEDLISIIISVVLNFIMPFNVFALSRAIPFFSNEKDKW